MYYRSTIGVCLLGTPALRPRSIASYGPLRIPTEMTEEAYPILYYRVRVHVLFLIELACYCCVVRMGSK